MAKKRICVFASGRGSNFQAILKRVQNNEIRAEIALCLTNNPGAGVIEIARKHNIPIAVISPKNYADAKSFNQAILNELLQSKIDCIVLAGYLKLIGDQIIEKYENRIINIHPALLPSFGGKGMYGHHVHEAVFRRGVKVSGATVHLVNREFDAGPIVMQKCVPVDDLTSAEDIAQRVLKVEHEIYPQAVKLLVENRLRVVDNRVEITGEKEID